MTKEGIMVRTEKYRYTVTMENGYPTFPDIAKVNALREYIKYLNRENGTTFYVKLQGRGPRKIGARKYFQSLPLKFAKTADVYVYERR
jgi:cytochrome c